MIDNPKTVEECRSIRYGSWAGSPKGTKYNEDHCGYQWVHTPWNWYFVQCSRKNGHGPNGLYCKQHAKMVEK